MSQFKNGARVEHRTASESFGMGTVIENENPTTGSVLVLRDKQLVTRESSKLPREQSHVSASSLTLIST